jgi:hypothetical protein
MIRMTARLRTRVLALAAGLIVAGCQSAQPTAGPTSAATGAPPSVAASTAPSPSAAANVAPLFVEAMKGLSSGVVDLDGSATVGPIKVTISGTSTFDGPDNQGTLTTTVGGVSSVVETVLVAGKSYSKTGDGPWLPAATRSGGDLTGSLKNSAAGSFTDQGTESRNGATVHKLVASSGSAFDPSVFLASATGVSNVSGTTTFYCADDGTPAGATIQLTWTQTAGTQSLDASMTFEINFSSLGTAQSIRAPEAVWQRFDVAKKGYSIAYPPGYDHTAKQGYDYFVAPESSFYFASRIDTQGLSLNLIARSETSSAKSLLNTKTVTNTATTMGGVAGRLLSAKGTSADLGGKVVFYEAIVVKGKFAYFVAWVSKQGNEAADLATFRQVIATFRFLA